MTDEQVNRIMSGQEKWDTHGAPALAAIKEDNDRRDRDMAAFGEQREYRPYGPGLNVTVPRADLDFVIGAGDGVHETIMSQDPLGQPAMRAMASTIAEDITEADIVAEMKDQGLGLPPVALVTAGAICQQAADITAGDRQKQNGDKLPNHENIAALWSAYLDVAIDAHQAATMMVLLKVARTKLGAFNTDDYVDMAGYAGCAAEIRHRSNQEQQ